MDEQFLPRVPVRTLDGSEPLAGFGTKTVSDYWRWAHSDILENVQRGIFAEFLVAGAVGVTHVQRIGQTGFDIDYDGFKIEVKSSAYLQSWNQRKLTSPKFYIGPRQQLDEYGISYEGDPRYVADCYVFALFAATDPKSANVLDTEQWAFYVISIEHLIAACGAARSISLRRIEQLTRATPYSRLLERIDRVKAGLDIPQNVVTRSGPPERTEPVQLGVRTYLVARRKSRESPVIVDASDYKQAQLLARTDATIASYGTDVSAFALSRPQLEAALRKGARDLRRSENEASHSSTDSAG